MSVAAELARPIWDAYILRERATFVAAALGGEHAVRRFERNPSGRDFVVGDIHGMFPALGDFLDQLRFDPATDRLFSVGDLVDRGPESAAAREWLGRPWFHAIRGNHDQFMLDADADPAGEAGEEHELWIDYNGGGWWRDTEPGIQRELVECFARLPFALEIDCDCGTVGIVHADLPPDRDWAGFLEALRSGSRADSFHAIWSRRRAAAAPGGGGEEWDVPGGPVAIFCGHTRIDAPVRHGNFWNIDTGAVYVQQMRRARFTIARIHPGAIELSEFSTRHYA